MYMVIGDAAATAAGATAGAADDATEDADAEDDETAVPKPNTFAESIDAKDDEASAALTFCWRMLRVCVAETETSQCDDAYKSTSSSPP